MNATMQNRPPKAEAKVILRDLAERLLDDLKDPDSRVEIMLERSRQTLELAKVTAGINGSLSA